MSFFQNIFNSLYQMSVVIMIHRRPPIPASIPASKQFRLASTQDI